MPRTLPDGLERSGGTPEFTQDTVPDALRASHALAAGRWGLLHVISGALVFVDEETGAESVITAPAEWVIPPERRHHVRIPEAVTFRIDFYRPPA
ncbi:MAG: DUF1971 domain-containing protein [Alphaproteobacteria bacterium]